VEKIVGRRDADGDLEFRDFVVHTLRRELVESANAVDQIRSVRLQQLSSGAVGSRLCDVLPEAILVLSVAEIVGNTVGVDRRFILGWIAPTQRKPSVRAGKM